MSATNSAGGGVTSGWFGEALGLDIELDGCALGEVEDFVEGGDFGAGDGDLRGERGRATERSRTRVPGRASWHG